MTGAGRPPHPGPNLPDLTPSAELRRLMRAWRDRLDRHTDRRSGTSGGEPVPRVTQDALARRLGVTPTWYRNLERGIRAGYSTMFLDKVARVLRLDVDERHVLYLLAAGRLPAARAGSPATAITDPVTDIVHTQPCPAYIVDAAWDVQVRNHAMDDWFPQLRQVENIMRMAFCIPDTRHQLVDFEGDWAPSMLGQIRGALARWPNNPRLNRLVTDILASNNHARRLWHQPVVRIHADGERRRLYVPHTTDPCLIEIVAFSLMRAENLRMILLKPVRDGRPADPRPPPAPA